jgi:putative nucleotidyltransferase with HDIG domain
MQLARDPNVAFDKIKRLVEAEPMLAGKVLTTAQSAYYSRGTAMTSLEDAMARLGLRTLADLFLQAAMSARVFRAPGFERPMEVLRKHSVVTATMARSVCRQTGFPDEYAYMCGLLHDVGMAACILLVADVPRGEPLPVFGLVAPSIELVHAEASGVVVRAWQLPTDVQLVVEHHQQFLIGGRAHPLAAAICLADWLAAGAGASAGGEACSDAVAKSTLEVLRLSESQFQRLVDEAKVVAAAL